MNRVVNSVVKIFVIFMCCMLMAIFCVLPPISAQEPQEQGQTLETISAAGFGQTRIPADSPAYEYLRVISAEQQLASVIIERPATRARFLEVLEHIDADALSPSGRELYSRLLKELSARVNYSEEGGLALGFSAQVNVEAYGESDRDHGEWFWADANRLPFVNFPLEAWFSDAVYLRFELPVKKEPFLHEYVPNHTGNWINIPADFSQPDYQFPYVAYASAGGRHWDLQVGRDVLSYGSGRSGNFLVGDEVPYYSFIRGSTHWDAFSFYYTAADLEPWPVDTDRSMSGIIKSEDLVQRILLTHGFRFSIDRNVRISLKESSLMTKFNPTMNYLNPLMIFHNWYWDASNSFAELEVEWMPMKGLTLYGSYAMDQLQTFFEKDRYDADAVPNAYGYLLGAEFSAPRGGGYWLGTLEWVYTNPWLYIHEDRNASFVWTGHIEENVDSAYFKQMPLGYPSGPDSMNLSADIGYRKPGLGALFGGYRFRAKGEQSLLETDYSEKDGAAALRTPTGTPEFSHTGWIEASWNPPWYEQLKEIGAAAAYTFVQNEGNQAGENHHDLQWSLHVSLAF